MWFSWDEDKHEDGNPGDGINAWEKIHSFIFYIIVFFPINSPFGYGVSQRVKKSTIGWSISRTVMAFPCMIVKLGLRQGLSYDNPPENITNGSLY